MTPNKRVYPAIFHKEGKNYWVEFPDIPSCMTQGHSIEQAYLMAKEALALALDNEKCKTPTPLEKVIASSIEDRIMLVEAGDGRDIVHYRNPDIPTKIDEGLRKKGYTKYQAAQVLGVTRAYITRIANGERVPSVDMAKRIGLLLGFDWKLFYSNSREKRASTKQP